MSKKKKESKEIDNSYDELFDEWGRRKPDPEMVELLYEEKFPDEAEREKEKAKDLDKARRIENSSVLEAINQWTMIRFVRELGDEYAEVEVLPMFIHTQDDNKRFIFKKDLIQTVPYDGKLYSFVNLQQAIAKIKK